MFFDTHCHLNFQIFHNDLSFVIRKTLADDVWFVIVGTHYENSKRGISIARKYKKGVYSTVGLHPIHLIKQKIIEGGVEFVTSGETFEYSRYKKLIESSRRKGFLCNDVRESGCHGRIVAVGECGLDYFYSDNKNIRETQVAVFIEHIRLASEFQLPVIIHARGNKADPVSVYNDLIKILESERISVMNGVRGIVHSFMGTVRQAKRLVEMGFLLGINGMIMTTDSVSAVVCALDIENFVLETDSPFFSPNGSVETRNEPRVVQIIGQQIAHLKSISVYEVQNITTRNALHIFNLIC